jgi:hypothetical protein
MIEKLAIAALIFGTFASGFYFGYAHNRCRIVSEIRSCGAYDCQIDGTWEVRP